MLVGCLDEIFFHRQPVLVGIEPHSMVWFLGKKAVNHQGSTWSGELQSWTALRYVTSDAGAGLKAGITRMQRHQRQLNQVPLEKGLDVFHTKREARRVLNIMWQRVERCWERADVASRAVEKQRRARHQRSGENVPGALGLGKKLHVHFKLYGEERNGLEAGPSKPLKYFRPWMVSSTIERRRKNKSHGLCPG